MSKIYGYARVSSKSQLIDGNSLESQTLSLIERGVPEGNIYKEQYTGTTTKRPVFEKLISTLNSGDTLMVTKLDRFARSTIEGAKIVQELLNNGIDIEILNMGRLDNTPASKLTRTMFFAFAEYERDMIIERTQEGKAIAKTKEGFTEGRPRLYTDTQLNMALDLLKNHSYTEVEKMTQISKSTLIRAMRKRKADIITKNQV